MSEPLRYITNFSIIGIIDRQVVQLPIVRGHPWSSVTGPNDHSTRSRESVTRHVAYDVRSSIHFGSIIALALVATITRISIFYMFPLYR